MPLVKARSMAKSLSAETIVISRTAANSAISGSSELASPWSRTWVAS